MDLKQRYIRDKGYDVEQEFMDELKSFDSKVALEIALFLEDNVRDLKPNEFTTYVYGGLVMVELKPVTFAIEIMRVKYRHLTFTDISLISMDEYLDLMLIDCYIKPNEATNPSMGKYRHIIQG
jgi:hypothetical protein|tara:strand:- start:186 stop:554 length:369 start_codon:yes stop_codon:yes gene_type:complete